MAGFRHLGHRHHHVLLTKGIDLIFYRAGFKVTNFNKRPCKILLGHAGGHLDGQAQLVDLSNAAVFDKDYRVQYVRYHAQLDSAHEALDRV